MYIKLMAASLCISCAHAKAGEWSLGLASSHFKQEYRGVESESVVFPSLNYESDTLYFIAGEFWLQVAKGESWDLGITLTPDFRGYKPQDSQALTGMERKKSSVLGGLSISTWGDWGLITLDIDQDLLGNHKGARLGLEYSLPLELNQNWHIQPYVKMNYYSQDYLDYYYGVSRAESTSERPYYQAEADFGYAVGSNLLYKISSAWELGLGIEYHAFGDQVKDSPITDKASQTQVSVLIAYKF